MTPAAVLLACAVAVADWGPVRVDAEGVPLPPGVAARLGSTRFRHSGDLIDLRFTPDGRQLVGATTRAITVWNTATGLRVATHTGFRRISHLAIRPDGNIALLASLASVLHYVVIDRETGRMLVRHELAADHDDIILSADGSRIAQRFGGLVRVFDTTTWKLVGDLRFSISDISPNHFTFSPDGQHLAAVFSNNWTEVREVATGNMPYAGLAEGLESDVQEIAFAADGRELLRLVHTNGKPYRLESIDLKTEKVRTLMEFENPGKRRGGLLTSPDGRSIFFAAQDEVTRFDLKAKRQMAQHKIPAPTIIGRVTCSSDGTRIAVSLSNSCIQILDAAAVKMLPQSSDAMDARASSAQFVDGGRKIALSGSRSAQLYDVQAKRLLKHFRPGENQTQFQFHPDGVHCVRSSPTAIDVFDWRTERVKFQREFPSRVWFSRDGRLIFSNDSNFYSWDWAADRSHSILPCREEEHYRTSDGLLGILVSERIGLDRFDLDAFDITTGQSLPGWQTIPSRSDEVLFHPDGRRVLVRSTGRDCCLIDAREFRTCWSRPISRGTESGVFSPDGRTLAVSSRRSIQFWEISTGRLRHSIPSLETQRPLAFSPDGKHLAAIGPTAPLYLWDVRGALKNGSAKLDRPTTEALWKDLLADDAEAAFLALRRLAAASETTLPFVRETVRPAVAPAKEKVAAWIAALDAPAFRDREAAMKELKKAADTVAVELRAARAATPSLEVHERLSKILATTYPETPESVRRTRTVELVEWCGTADAKQLLREWSAGAPGALLTAEAETTLARLR
jgi:WD40 repeat protein